VAPSAGGAIDRRRRGSRSLYVMAGLVPAIHVFFDLNSKQDVDARVKPAHDDAESVGDESQPRQRE